MDYRAIHNLKNLKKSLKDFERCDNKYIKEI